MREEGASAEARGWRFLTCCELQLSLSLVSYSALNDYVPMLDSQIPKTAWISRTANMSQHDRSNYSDLNVLGGGGWVRVESGCSP